MTEVLVAFMVFSLLVLLGLIFQQIGSVRDMRRLPPLGQDRAGLGWSDAGPMPRASRQIVEELHMLLRNAQVEGAYVLVGHSFGSFNVRLYASTYPEEVAGMVLVDPIQPGDWLHLTTAAKGKLASAVKLSRYGAMLARLGVATSGCNFRSSWGIWAGALHRLACHRWDAR